MRRLSLAAVVIFSAAPAQAWEDGWLDANVPLDEPGFFYEGHSDTVMLRGSFGAMALQSREYVFNAPGSPYKTSYLLWQGVAPYAATELKLRLPLDITVKGELRGAMGGIGLMEDYDWLGPYAPSYDFNDWSHRSEHSNTRLDWYLDATLSIGRDVYADETSRVNLNVGAKYTDLQWTSRGGHGIYSVGGFRDSYVVFPDSPGITYRQQFPAAFAGIDIEIKDGDWTWAASAKGGYTLLASASDNHWLRGLLFTDTLKPAPIYAANLSGAYNFNDHVSGYLEGAIEQVLLGRGDTTQTGASIGYYADQAGAELLTLSLSAGLKGSF